MLLLTNEELIRSAIDENKQEKTASKLNAKYVEFDDLPKPKGKIPKDVDKWIPSNFVSFVRILYREKYKKDWDLNFSAQCNEILLTKDNIVNHIGYCDNKTLKLYIEWFFQNYIDEYMKRDGCFFLKMMRDLKVLQRFSESKIIVSLPKYKAKPKPSKTVETKALPHNLFDKERMSSSFLLSDEGFVLDYGIIMSISYLVNVKKYEPREAAKAVYDACVNIVKSQGFDKIRLATERFNPYPTNSLFTNADKFAKKLNPEFEVKIKTKDGAWPEITWLLK